MTTNYYVKVLFVIRTNGVYEIYGIQDSKQKEIHF